MALKENFLEYILCKIYDSAYRQLLFIPKGTRQKLSLALRKIILQQDTHVSESKKYGMPCFCYHKTMFCYLWTDKITDEPYILLVEGKHLNHQQLEIGERSRMKILRINPNQDLPLETIESILQNALDLYRTGVVKFRV